MSSSETQANVAPAAAPAKAKQEPSASTDSQQQKQPSQQQQAPPQQQQRPPKLAPAPVPQQTPWKAPSLDQPSVDVTQSQKKGSPTVVAAAAAAASSSQRTKEREQQSGSAKRATTGKEKWVPFAPVPIPSQQQQNGSRPRQNKRQAQNGGFRGRRSQGNDKRREPRGAGHQRTQSSTGNGNNSNSNAGGANSNANTPANAHGNSNNSSNSSSTNSGNSGNNSGSSGSGGSTGSTGASSSNNAAQGAPDVEKLSLDDRSSDRRFPRYSRPPQNRKVPRMGKMPYYPSGGFAPGPGGMGYTMPVVPMTQVVPALASPEYLFPTLVPQVDYYFSVENLCKDMFLRKNMNNQGLVPVSVIADFNRVKMLTQSVEMVAQACGLAHNIEVVGSKVRAAHNWERWVLPESDRTPFGLDNKPEDEEPKFQVDQAVPFVPKSEK